MLPESLGHRTLAAIAPFTALPEHVHRQVLGRIDLRVLTAGDRLFLEGAEATAICVVVAGRVTVSRADPSVGCRTVCLVGQGGLCCCVAALDGGPYPGTATAKTRSLVAYIPTDVFRALLGSHPGFADAVMRQIGAQLRRYQCNGTPAGAVRIRIATSILAAARHFGRTIPVTRRELSELAGTTVETAIRETLKLQEEGLLHLSRGVVRVVNQQGLEAVVAGSGAKTGGSIRRPA